MKIAAKQLQMDTLLLLTAYRKSPLQRPIQWYHRRPPTTYRLATIHPLRRPSVTRIDESKTVQAKITKSSPSAARKTPVLGSFRLASRAMTLGELEHQNRGFMDFLLIILGCETHFKSELRRNQ